MLNDLVTVCIHIGGTYPAAGLGTALDYSGCTRTVCRPEKMYHDCTLMHPAERLRGPSIRTAERIAVFWLPLTIQGAQFMNVVLMCCRLARQQPAHWRLRLMASVYAV
jgi:hypothetical protein